MFGVIARGFTGPVSSGPNPDYMEPGILEKLIGYITGNEPVPPGYEWIEKGAIE